MRHLLEKKGNRKMPGKHGANKKYISFLIERKLWYKMTQYAQEHDMDRTTLAVMLFENKMEKEHVELNPENREKLRMEIENASLNRTRHWALKDPTIKRKPMAVLKAEARARKEAQKK